MIGLIKRIFSKQPAPAKKPAAELIEDLKTFRIDRDDIIVICAKQILTPNQKHGLEELFRLQLNIENKIVIFDEGISIGIMRQ